MTFILRCLVPRPTPHSQLLHLLRPVATMASRTASSPQHQPQFYRRKLPDTCIAFHSAEGKQIFTEALATGFMNCYFGLATQFRTQDEPAYCGLSTLVMVLNTLEVDPRRVWKGVWRWYHEDMLDCCVPLDVAAKSGITMDHFACLASCNALTVKMVRAAPEIFNEDNFRQMVKDLTKREDEVLVVSYNRRTLGQTGSGHFSPVGGYHPDRDMVLILDTARFKYPPHWVSLSLLCEAMKAIDPDTALPRGYLKLSKSGMHPMLLYRIAKSLSISVTDTKEPQFGDDVKSFLDKWNQWLRSPSEMDADCSFIQKPAITAFLAAISESGLTDCLLTTQINIKCPENLSSEYACSIHELFNSMESMELFKIIDEHLNSDKDAVELVKKIGVSAMSPRCCQHYEESNNPGCPVPELRPAHFMLALLLTWPSKQCKKTNGNALRKAAMAQLSIASQVLQNEMALLHQQLDSLFSYINRCRSGGCHYKGDPMKGSPPK